MLSEAFASLDPIPVDEIPADPDLPAFLQQSFAHAERLANSIPSVSPVGTSGSFDSIPANSAKNAQDTLCDETQVPGPSLKRNAEDTKGWGKPLKLGAKENPLGAKLYKHAAHDRHGAWFARRSVHQGLGFEKFLWATRNEFLVSLKVQEGPGSGAVRGLAADRRLLHKTVNDNGVEAELAVWQTSSVFPGPVAPRESVTLLVSSSAALSDSPPEDASSPPARHFLTLSRPTRHADAPARPDLVKMEYESVEMIREIPLPQNTDDPERNPVEWIMITRSDPGGGLPKFLVERGTPGSIASDMVKFLNWATTLTPADMTDDALPVPDEVQPPAGDASLVQDTKTEESARPATAPPEKQAGRNQTPVQSHLKPEQHARPSASTPHLTSTAEKPGPSLPESHGGMVSKFVGGIENTVSGYLPYFGLGGTHESRDGGIGPYQGHGGNDGNDDSDATSSVSSSDSSVRTFTSAHTHHKHLSIHGLTPHLTPLGGGGGGTAAAAAASDNTLDQSAGDSSAASSSQHLPTKDGTSPAQGHKSKPSRHDKEIAKLLHKRSLLDAKAQQAHATALRKQQDADAAVVAKHERQRQRQEERYMRAVAKLEEKRVKEEKSMAARRRKEERKDEVKWLRSEVKVWKGKWEEVEREAEALARRVVELELDAKERGEGRADAGPAADARSEKSRKSDKISKDAIDDIQEEIRRIRRAAADGGRSAARRSTSKGSGRSVQSTRSMQSLRGEENV